MKNQPKVSFCTVCMNRLEHLSQTLPINIKNNKEEPDIEFVLLDYNSSDGLEDWVKTNMKEHLDSGILQYYKTTDYTYFNRSHSRNMMFRLAKGEIICNIDADNYTGKGFASYVKSVFNQFPDSLIIPNEKLSYFNRDIIGKFCSLKSDFHQIRGYDENMNGYGFEDNDLYERLRTLNKKTHHLSNSEFMNGITHGDDQRIKNEFYTHNIDSFFIHYANTETSEIIILFKNNEYFKGTIIPNTHATPAPVFIKNNIWKKGKWKKTSNLIQFTPNSSSKIYQSELLGNTLTSDNKIFYKITEPSFLDSMNLSLPIITNQGIFFNKQHQKISTNKNGFGQGNVYTLNNIRITLN